MADYREQRDDNNILTGYTRTSDGASIPLAARNTDYQAVLEWLQSNTADPDSNVIKLVRQKKIAEYGREGVRRIALQVPEWDTLDIVKVVASIWPQLNNHTAAQLAAKDTYVFVKNTVRSTINGMTDITAIQALDAPTDTHWPN